MTQRVGLAAPAMNDLIETDAVIIGAGPVGLFQVFELGLLEVKVHVIDALAYPGGQCVELYPDKPIYDIPAVPVCTGQELTDNLLKQIAPFGATFHFEQQVTAVEKNEDGRFKVVTSAGNRFLSKTIFIAAGVGAFQARTLKIDGLDAFNEKQVFYKIKNPHDFAGQHVIIVGGGESAVQWALDFVKNPSHKALSVILIHRRDSLDASPAIIAEMTALCEAGEMQFVVGQITGYKAQDGQLQHVQVTGSNGDLQLIPLDVLMVFNGLSPQLGPITHWGLELERRQIKVDTERFSTSEPGIFAVGDINTYPGKKKLILSGFHECALAAFGAMPIISPEKKVFLLYTTTSPKLHKMLGVGQ